MSSDILNAMDISASGMKVQGARIRVISENLANAQTTGNSPGADPYTRQQISFQNVMDKEIGARLVEVKDISEDTQSPFPMEYMPDHPAANEEGYVKMPNVKTTVEVMDVREAQRSYEANLGMIEQSRKMVLRTIDLLNK